MNLLISLVVLLASINAFSQNERAVESDAYWVEIKIPVIDVGPFENTREDEINTDAGVGVGFGWRPWVKEIKDTDSVLSRFLKGVGISADLTQFGGGDFNQFLYDLLTPVNNISSCYQSTYDQYNGRENFWNNKCKPCEDSPTGFCMEKAVYGRDTYVKYVDRSLAIGLFVPVAVAKRISLVGGANLRLHFVKEGIQTDQLDSSLDKSVTALFGARYQISRHWGASVTAEKSFSGLPYQSFSGNFGFSWGGKKAKK